MSQSPVDVRVKSIIVKLLGVSEQDVSADKAFTDDLGADSLDVVELMLEMESEFRLDIPEEEAEKIRTVGDAITYINSHRA